MTKIKHVQGIELVDSQGISRVAAAVVLDSGACGFAAASRRYRGSTSAGALTHFFTVLRDRPVRLAMSLNERWSRKCIRLTLPIMSMVITCSPR